MVDGSTVEALSESPDVAAVASKVLDWDGARIDYVDGGLTWYGMGYKPHVGTPDDGAHDTARDVLFDGGADPVVVRPGITVEEADDVASVLRTPRCSHRRIRGWWPSGSAGPAVPRRRSAARCRRPRRCPRRSAQAPRRASPARRAARTFRCSTRVISASCASSPDGSEQRSIVGGSLRVCSSSSAVSRRTSRGTPRPSAGPSNGPAHPAPGRYAHRFGWS